MADQSGVDPRVYQPTTEADRSKGGSCCVWWQHLKRLRFAVKSCELVLSFIAFICEEVVEHCESCGGLYFFEFVSCTAFLLCIVVLVLYCTKCAEQITLKELKHLDLWFSTIVAIFFFLASIIFAATNTGSSLEITSFVFGFLATCAFLLDVYLLWKGDVRFLKSHREEADPNQPPENDALNDERSDA